MGIDGTAGPQWSGDDRPLTDDPSRPTGEQSAPTGDRSGYPGHRSDPSVEPSHPSGDPSGPTVDASRRPGLGKPARVAILVVALGGLLLFGLVVSNRNREAYDHAMTRVQLEAEAAGDSIDVDAFWSAWARETTGQWGADEARPARALVPQLDGAELSNYFAGADPVQAIIDYQVEAGGQEGCVRLTRTIEGTKVITADDVCVKSFLGGP